MVLKRRGLPTFIFFLSCLSLLIIFSIAEAGSTSGEEVTFSKGKVNDRYAEEDFTFVFTISIFADDEPGSPVELVVDERTFVMKEVDHQDTNYSDGKAFQFERKFGPGPKYFYFQCGDQFTSASTFNVEEFTFLEQYHPDIVLAMIIFIAPIVYFLILLNRMKRTTITLSKELNSLFLRSRKNEHVKSKALKRADEGSGSTGNKLGGIILLLVVMIFISSMFLLPVAGSDQSNGESRVVIDGARAGENEDIEVTFSNEAIQPTWGHGGDTFLFTVTITSEHEPNEPLEMLINDQPNFMNEINPVDTNFSDGKDYYHKDTVDEGGWVVFFRTGNHTSKIKPLTVAETRQAQYHYDVAAIMTIFIVPVVIGVLIFKRMQKEMETVCLTIADLSKEDREQTIGK